MRETDKTRGKGRALVLACGVFAATLAVFAFPPVPKESAKALLVTRGKPFTAGAVFINGKYVEPPYVVERWGTGIRINGKPVTGQVIDWDEFVKTQAGAKVVRQEPPANAAPAASASVPSASEDVDASSLDDLFDDDPKPKKKPAAVRKPVVVAAKPVTSYVLEGDFVPNDATKAMVARINDYRTEIDRALRSGGFICFGDTYSQVSGDSRMLLNLLEKLPEFQKNARDVQDFCGRIRSAGMVYLNEVLRMDLYRNRVDYRKLQELRTKLKKDGEMQKLIDEVSTPLF